MARLVNRFSWSHSAAADFEACRRRRYYAKYAAWGGWERGASEESRLAYRLNKMSNRYALQGIAAEDGVMWMLRETQAGRPASADLAWRRCCKPMLARLWQESVDKAWMREAKRCCLHEHYYPEFCGKEDLEMKKEVAAAVQSCLKHFEQQILPQLKEVRPEDEVPIAVVGKGDAEHFELDGLKIYAIPDYVFRRGDLLEIWDWKSGRPKEEHADQIRLYALWAGRKHGIPPERIQLKLIYLQEGGIEEVEVEAEHLYEVGQRIAESVEDMRQYLIAEDLQKNEAMPKEEWELCYEPAFCKRCGFWELCKQEPGLAEEVLPAG